MLRLMLIDGSLAICIALGHLASGNSISIMVMPNAYTSDKPDAVLSLEAKNSGAM